MSEDGGEGVKVLMMIRVARTKCWSLLSEAQDSSVTATRLKFLKLVTPQSTTTKLIFRCVEEKRTLCGHMHDDQGFGASVGMFLTLEHCSQQ